MIFWMLLYPAMIAAQQPALSLIPVPANVQPEAAACASIRHSRWCSPGIPSPPRPRRERFLHQLARQTALPLSLKPAKNSKATLIIQTEHASKEIQEVAEDESYVLEVSATGEHSLRRRPWAPCMVCRLFFS